MWQHILATLRGADKNGFKRWKCLACSFIYDEAKGWPNDGIPAGTHWEDVPEDWICPKCGATKDDFEMIRLR